MSEYLIRTLLNDIDIGPPKKLSIKYPNPCKDLLSHYDYRRITTRITNPQ